MSRKEAILKLCGAITSLLTVLSGVTYALGDAATIIPPEWKERVFLGSAFATVGLRAWMPTVAIIKILFGIDSPDEDTKK